MRKQIKKGLLLLTTGAMILGATPITALAETLAEPTEYEIARMDLETYNKTMHSLINYEKYDDYDATNNAQKTGNYDNYDDYDDQDFTDDESIPKESWVKTAAGWKYKLYNGEWAKYGTLLRNGKYYHMDSNGIMQANYWHKTKNGKEDNWRYYKADGTMAEHWEKIDGKWYLFDDANFGGSMLKGFQAIYGKWYYLSPDTGEMLTGWQWGEHENTSIATENGFEKIPPAWRYLNPGSGEAITGWFKDTNGKWYYMDGGGIMQTGWVKYNEKWYYLGEDGAMLANTTTPDGYRVNENGEWIQ